jgi:hypothetical protein
VALDCCFSSFLGIKLNVPSRLSITFIEVPNGMDLKWVISNKKNDKSPCQRRKMQNSYGMHFLQTVHEYHIERRARVVKTPFEMHFVENMFVAMFLQLFCLLIQLVVM